MTPGSTRPQRVPMMRPSSGVSPIVVSRHSPFFTAASEEPLPRWQVTRLTFFRGFFSHAAAAWVRNLCDVPWKPYFRRPYFFVSGRGSAYS